MGGSARAIPALATGALRASGHRAPQVAHWLPLAGATPEPTAAVDGAHDPRGDGPW